MKVCIVRNSESDSNPGILRVTDALLSCNNEVLLLTRKRNRLEQNKRIFEKQYSFKSAVIKNYEIQFFGQMGKGIKNLFNLLAYQFIILAWLLKNNSKFEAIHSFDLDTGISAFIVTKLFRKKFIYHIADFYVDSRRGIPKVLKKYVKKLEYYIISKADATIICTQERRTQIKGSKPKQLYVMHNSPLEELTYEKININSVTLNDNNVLKLCYVGLLSEIRFIKEILEIVKNDKRFILNIAGFGVLESYVKDYAEKYSNINFYGKVIYKESLKLYRNSDIMFAMYNPNHPNHKYSAPNKVYEAMMLGKPIIVAKNTGIDELVFKEKIGFVVDYKTDSFISVLDNIFNNRNILTEINNVCENVYNKYSWANVKKNIFTLYNRLENE